MHSGGECEEELYGLPSPNPAQPFYTPFQAYKNNPSSSNQNTELSEIFGIHDTLPSANPTQDSAHFSTFYTNASFPADYHIHPLHHHEFSSNTSSYSNNSNSMVATVDRQGTENEVRRKRLVSNRESARKTRLRRKKQIEELQSQNHHLVTMNQKLTEQLINLSQCVKQIFQENAQLKEEISFLQSVVANHKAPLGDPEEVARCSTHLTAGGSNPSIFSSVNSLN